MPRSTGVKYRLGNPLCYDTLGATFIILAMLASTVKGFGVAIPSSLIGLGFWLALLLLWNNVAAKTRTLGMVLLSVGAASMAWGLSHQQELDWSSILGANTSIVSMVVAVSFLSLVTRPDASPKECSLKGRRGFLATLFGVHLFGSVINLSAAFIYGDRAAHQTGQLDRLQTLALNRGMTTAAFWSPFFASMAVTLSYAPDAQLSHLLLMGLPLAASGLGLSYFELTRNGQSRNFQGYPLHLSSLWLPLLLVLSVLAWHHQQPHLSVLLMVTTLVPLLSIGVLLTTPGQDRYRQVLSHLKNHSSQRLPRMVNEITLFLAAGFMTQGLALLVDGLGGWLLFDSFGAWQAIASLLAIVATAILGLHPIIGISVLASLVDAEGAEQTLLGMVFLASWGIGTAVSPLSGINLALHGRYGTDIYKVMRWNLLYAAAMFLPVVVVLSVGAFFIEL